jgi:hypothetical protein
MFPCMRFLVLRPLFSQAVVLNPALQLATAQHLYHTTAAALQQQRCANCHLPAAIHCAIKQTCTPRRIPLESEIEMLDQASTPVGHRRSESPTSPTMAHHPDSICSILSDQALGVGAEQRDRG